MNLIFIAAFIVACEAAKLDRTYLPPSSPQFAGGPPPGSLQTPFFATGTNGINQGFLHTTFGRTSDNNPSRELPLGSYENEHQGVVVEAAAPGSRASNQPSGLGGPRVNYGSTDSKVGEAAFRGTKHQARPVTQNVGFQSQAQVGSFPPQGPVSTINQDYPDLSAFYQPANQVNPGYRPGNQLFTDRVSNTVKYHMNIGLDKFNYGYETENGIKMQENGVSSDGVKTQGGYSYTGDDGKVYSVMYTADKNGYRPVGSHLPTPPPIPDEILKSLQQNARDEANGINDDGSYDAQKYNAQDDYAQSDTNGNNNDRQSNKFGERPGFNAGAGAVINQNQQAIVKPNGQGQFSSYDFSKDSPSTQSDNSKFKTDMSDNTSNNGNILSQNGQTSQFGTQSQYLPPPPHGTFQNSNSFLQIHSPEVGFHNNFNNAPSQSEQINRNQGSFGKPILAINKQNYYGSNSGLGSLNGNLSPSIQGSNTFGINSHKINPQNDGEIFQSYMQNSLIGSNFGLQFSDSAQNSSVTHGNDSDLSQENITNNPQSQTSLSKLNVGITSQNNIDNSAQSQGSSFQTSFPNSVDSRQESINSDLNSQFSPTFSSQILSTKQPDLFLSTPIQTQGQQTNSDFSVHATSSTASQPQKPYSYNSINPQSILLSDEIPTNDQFNKKFPGQPQGPDNSYIYNKPSKAFNIPSAQTGLNKTPSLTSSPLGNSVIQSVGTLFPNTQEGFVFSAQYPGETGSTKYPKPTLAPITSTLSTKGDETETNTYYTNGITQASISSFPSIFPTSLSHTNSELYEYTKPVQGLTVSSQKDAGVPKLEITQQSSLLSSQIEEKIKPQVSFKPNTQFNDRFPTPSTSSFVQQTSSSQSGEQTSSTFGQKPSELQFGTQDTTSFEQLPTLSTFGVTTSSSFGQKTSQQQDKTIPSFFNAQTSTQVGQGHTVSQSGEQASTSLNQQTTPTRFVIQTGSLFGQKPTQPQSRSSFGQLTTPSRLDAQTSSAFGQTPTLSPFGTQTSSFGQQTTPSRFGAQTSSIFSQNNKPSQLQTPNKFSFGSQTTPSRFGVETGSSFDQKSTLSSIGTSLNQQITPTSFSSQTSSLFGQQTPSELGVHTSSTFDPKLTPTQLGEQTSFSFGSQTTPSRFGTQTSSSFGSQTTPSRFDISSRFSSGYQTTPTPFGVQTGTGTSAQTDSSFGQQTTPFRFGVQTSSANGQKATLSPFSEQTSPTFGNKITSPQFDDLISEKLSTTQILGNFNKQQSQSEESNEQSDNQSDSKPSTLQPNIFNSQNSQESIENTSSDEIYQYNKPTTGLPFSQQLQGSAQFDQQSTTQSDDQSFASTLQNKPAQQSQKPLFPRFPENPTTGFQQSTTSKFIASTSSSEQNLDSNESTTSESSSTPSTDNTQYQPSTPVSSTSNTQSGFNLEKQEQSQNAESGEVYYYNKPAQFSTDSSQSENNKFGQNTQQLQNSVQTVQNKLDTTKPITSHLSPSGEKIDNVQIPTVSSFSATQTDSISRTTSSSSLGFLPSSHPFPHLSFYSACCRGSKTQNNQGSQSSSSTVSSSPLIGNLGGNSFGFNKNDTQNTNGNVLKENTFGNQSADSIIQDIGVQKDTPSFVGKGEEFGGPRKPPTFDETGYHY